MSLMTVGVDGEGCMMGFFSRVFDFNVRPARSGKVVALAWTTFIFAPEIASCLVKDFCNIVNSYSLGPQGARVHYGNPCRLCHSDSDQSTLYTSGTL